MCLVTARDTQSMQETIRKLYRGSGTGPRAFRFGVLTFDVCSILFFIATSLLETQPTWVYVVDVIIAVVITLDLGARYIIAERPARFLWDVVTWLDIIVILSLLLAPFVESLLFLRVLRALRLMRSYRVLMDLREEFPFFKRNEETIQSAINLGVFVFLMTALVYVLQVRTNPLVTNYIDALYFTVTALTTTGFGDITLTGTTGRLLSVFITIIGVALFLRLVQTIFRPMRVSYECPDCGLNKHDTDAVHCKHCGRLVHIATEGSDF
jgi:voltage-gated potassium channel